MVLRASIGARVPPQALHARRHGPALN